MDIKTVSQPPYSPDPAPYDFCLFPNLKGCPYETIEEMKEAVMKCGLREVVGRYKKCIAAGGDYFEGD